MTSPSSSSEVATEDVRAIAVALGLGGQARPYSAHEVVWQEILPALTLLTATRDAARQLLDVLDGITVGRKPKALEDAMDQLRKALP